MTEQEIERCLERLSSCKTADVMNFDYAGTFAYIKRLQEENAALRERLEEAMLNRRIYYLASIWNDATLTRRKEVRCRTVDYVCDKFVECDGLILNWDKICFTREAAEARLAELKGGKER